MEYPPSSNDFLESTKVHLHVQLCCRSNGWGGGPSWWAGVWRLSASSFQMFNFWRAQRCSLWAAGLHSRALSSPPRVQRIAKNIETRAELAFCICVFICLKRLTERKLKMSQRRERMMNVHFGLKCATVSCNLCHVDRARRCPLGSFDRVPGNTRGVFTAVLMLKFLTNITFLLRRVWSIIKSYHWVVTCLFPWWQVQYMWNITPVTLFAQD